MLVEVEDAAELTIGVASTDGFRVQHPQEVTSSPFKVIGCGYAPAIYFTKALYEFEPPIYGVEMGVAWGGSVEVMAKTWKGKGVVYGYDTFEGMPKFMAKDNVPYETDAVDAWYRAWGKDGLRYEYQVEEFARMGLDNVVLVKGLIHEDSCVDIPVIHYALLDLDINESMRIGYQAVKKKMIRGSYLVMHDCGGYMQRNKTWLYEEVLPSGEWEVEALPDIDGECVVLRKK